LPAKKKGGGVAAPYKSATDSFESKRISIQLSVRINAINENKMQSLCSKIELIKSLTNY
jgi:hypothetical protein